MSVGCLCANRQPGHCVSATTSHKVTHNAPLVNKHRPPWGAWPSRQPLPHCASRCTRRLSTSACAECGARDGCVVALLVLCGRLSCFSSVQQNLPLRPLLQLAFVLSSHLAPQLSFSLPLPRLASLLCSAGYAWCCGSRTAAMHLENAREAFDWYGFGTGFVGAQYSKSSSKQAGRLARTAPLRR